MARHTRHRLGQYWPFAVALVLVLLAVAVGFTLSHTVLAAHHPLPVYHPQPTATAPSYGPVPQPPVTAPVPQPVKMTAYEVKPGDTLWGIAGSHCGNPLEWRELWHANKSTIHNPDLIYPKQVIELAC